MAAAPQTGPTGGGASQRTTERGHLARRLRAAAARAAADGQPAPAQVSPDPGLLEPGPRGAWYRHYVVRAVVSDAAAALGAGLLGVVAPVGVADTARRLVVAVVLPVLWVGMLFLCHGYTRRFVGSTAEEYRAVARAVTYLALATAVGSYLTM